MHVLVPSKVCQTITSGNVVLPVTDYPLEDVDIFSLILVPFFSLLLSRWELGIEQGSSVTTLAHKCVSSGSILFFPSRINSWMNVYYMSIFFFFHAIP